jgi:hypothetical protein
MRQRRVMWRLKTVISEIEQPLFVLFLSLVGFLFVGYLFSKIRDIKSDIYAKS